jgi:alpha-beta hydrolase superfamily lysophospholipase
MSKHFNDYEAHAQHLEKIAESLDKSGYAYRALEHAGWALAFVTMYHSQEFQNFLDELRQGELSPDQQAHLRRFGLK